MLLSSFFSGKPRLVPTLPLETSAGIVEGADSLTVHLDKAVNGDCPVEHYQVEYKVKYSDMWLVVKEGINSNQKTVVISGLLPATWYNLRLMAKTNAGTITTAVYEVATLALHGGNLS